MPSMIPSFQNGPEASQLQAVALVNCGGGAFTDSEGNEWEADGHYQPAEPDSLSIQTTETILGTDDDALYSSARMFRRNRPGPYLYQIPIPAAGEYNVTLHFAEIDPNRAATGRRTANVVVEGTALESGFDIFEAAGGAGFTAVTLSTTVFANETLTVAFEVDKFNPIVSAIAVHQFVPASTAPSQGPSLASVSLAPSSAALSTDPSVSPTDSHVPSSLPSGLGSDFPS